MASRLTGDDLFPWNPMLLKSKTWASSRVCSAVEWVFQSSWDEVEEAELLVRIVVSYSEAGRAGHGDHKTSPHP